MKTIPSFSRCLKILLMFLTLTYKILPTTPCYCFNFSCATSPFISLKPHWTSQLCKPPPSLASIVTRLRFQNGFGQKIACLMLIKSCLVLFLLRLPTQFAYNWTNKRSWNKEKSNCWQDLRESQSSSRLPWWLSR